jgi:hypothetical protein
MHEGLFSCTLWTKSSSWESCQVTFHNWNSQWSQVSIPYQNIEALYIMSSYIGTFFLWNQISACFIFTWPEKLYPICSPLSWLAEFKHRNISANAVHVCGDWQHLKVHWEGERQSCDFTLQNVLFLQNMCQNLKKTAEQFRLKKNRTFLRLIQ